MKSRNTRKNRRCIRKGGGNANEQIQHALSQLKRFAERAREGKPFKTLQFGYNLGRLQEMVDGGKPGMHSVWWKPVEPLVESQNWEGLSHQIDLFQVKVGIDYDEATLRKE